MSLNQKVAKSKSHWIKKVTFLKVGGSIYPLTTGIHFSDSETTLSH